MNRQWNVVECPECGGSGKVTREAEATRTADRPSLRLVAEKLLAAIDAKDEANIHGWSAALRQAL